jgi:hypothetical protein
LQLAAEIGKLFDFRIKTKPARPMINRIVIAIIATSSVAPFAFGQMRYSRTKSQSPTPTPTPAGSPIPQQKMAPRPGQIPAKPSPTPQQKTYAIQPKATATPAQQQQLIPARRGIPAPTPAGSPTSQRMVAAPSPSKLMSPQRTTTMQMQSQPTPAPISVKPTPTPIPPPDAKAYLDREVAKSKDQKFHMTLNGKDVAMTPFHVWRQKETGPNSTSMCVDMRGDDGRIYDIDFMTTGAQVSGIRLHKINGEALR